MSETPGEYTVVPEEIETYEDLIVALEAAGVKLPGSLEGIKISPGDLKPDLRPHFTSDPKGTPILIRMPEGAARLIDKLIAEPGIPHATRQDFLRDAAFLYALALKEMLGLDSPAIQTIVYREQLASQAAYLAELAAGERQFLQHLHISLVELINRNALGEVARTLDAAWNWIGQFPGEYWRLTYKELVEGLAVVQAGLDLIKAGGVICQWGSERTDS